MKVEQFQGTTGEILARLEAKQENPVADVVILASWSDGLSMKAEDDPVRDDSGRDGNHGREAVRQGDGLHAQPRRSGRQAGRGVHGKTGVKVEQFQGTTGEILARLEAKQENPVADVVILASWSDGLSMKAEGKLESYTPANAEKVNPGWIDADSTLFGSSASAVGVICNTTVVPELNADWLALADAQYKDSLLRRLHGGRAGVRLRPHPRADRRPRRAGLRLRVGRNAL